MPANAAVNVALNTTIQITFSSAADASTVNTTNIVVTNPAAVSGSVSYNSANNTATFTPSAPLATGTNYTVKISGVTSSSGTAMASADSFSFTTAAASTTPLQYQASLAGNGANFGQATVDTSGNFTIQLVRATADQTFTVEFCPLIPQFTNQLNCFSLGAVSTNASGNGSLTAMFPKTGGWAGDFMLYTASNPNPNTQAYVYSTDLLGGDTTQIYMATLQLTNTVNGGTLNSGNPQTPLTSGTIAYSGTGGSNGSLTFTLTGAPANTTFSPAEGTIEGADYELLSSTGQSSFTTNSAGGLTFTVFQSASPGDIIKVTTQSAVEQGYVGGFWIP